MKKINLTLVILITLSMVNAVSQNKKSFFKNKDKILHFGASIFYAKPSMDLGDDTNGFEFFFANEKNETIKSDYTWDDKSTSKFPVYPKVYLQLDYGNHLFLRLDMYALWFSNSMSLKNSVDAGGFYGAYASSDTSSNKTDYSKFGYNNMKINWFFMGNTFTAGYVFLKTKPFQPYAIGGLSVMYLNKFGPANEGNERTYRTAMIFNRIDTYKLVTLYPVIGIGIKYRGLSIEFTYQFSGNVDTGELVYTDNEYQYTSNYNSISILNFSLNVNLFSRNLNKTKLNK